MFPCINFDERFADFTSAWMTEHRDEYKNFDAMEDDMPRIYMAFLNEPAKWLDGLTPGSYFTQYEDPKDLVDWLAAYGREGVPIPDLLLEQIESVGKPCEKRLLALLKDESEEVSAETRMTAISLLRSMGSTQPKMLYIGWQMNRQEDDELADNALESLADMGAAAVQPMLEALPKANTAGQAAMLDVLCGHPGNEQVFRTALRLFETCPDRCALFASYLGKLEDDRALPALIHRAQDDSTSYLDYIELRSAIERLGGTAPERDFSDDPAYEALSGLDSGFTVG